MTYKQIETSREIRLWITGVIVPAATTVGLLLQVPAIKEAVTDKTNALISRIKSKKTKNW